MASIVVWLRFLLPVLGILRSHSWSISTSFTRLTARGSVRKAIFARETLCVQSHSCSTTGSISVDYSWIPQTAPSQLLSPGSSDTVLWRVAPPDHAPVVETLRWCRNFVLPLALCPWAAASVQQLQFSQQQQSSSSSSHADVVITDQNASITPYEPTAFAPITPAMQFFSVKKSEDMERAVHHVARIFRDAVGVHKTIDPSVAIFFVLCEDRSWDFIDFYDWFCAVEEEDWDDEDDESDEDVQCQVTLAPFHPGWMFEDDGTATTNPSLQFEKKSPYPTVTLVWTDVIDTAGPMVSSKIGAQNEITLGRKSVAELTTLYQQCVYDDDVDPLTRY
jgi:hypothetical protein